VGHKNSKRNTLHDSKSRKIYLFNHFLDLMKWIYIVSILLLVLMTSVQCQKTDILDHSMASNIDDSTSKVITRSNTFTGTDSKVYSWLRLGNVGAGNSWANLENLGAGSVEWYWYSPDNNLYKTDSFDIPTPGSRAGWPS
jgi:hypothetical protein